MTDERKPATVPEHLNPIQLPRRFWVMVDSGLMTLEQAQEEWRRQQAEGVKG